MFLFHAESETVKGPVIHINCPNCLGHGVEAETGEVHETASIYFIPVPFRYTLVKCCQCRTVFLSKLPSAELATKTPKELQMLLRRRPDWVAGFFAVSSILTSPAFGFGIFLGIIAIVLGWKSNLWIKVVGLIGIALSVIMVILMNYRLKQAGLR